MAQQHLLEALAAARATVASLEAAIRLENATAAGEEPIPVKVAAHQFGLSTRQARRLAEDGLGVKVRGRWFVFASRLALPRVR